ncbi:DNA circularization protein [Oceanobacter sp. 4_MG-2023]|uniref:DNA circularization protein n=1 Tax=Oceanobacter sp. 4_MG-2023 TaxID=3062623 RepID=UPI0027341955|nr:DNA circularization N-terminal domain-containing protein [Oceanobacter sp. 4_MG-2023]MDP2548478.1 DNA circularization N-terminal domain-containing protein [Oceanobacter sp. 4_MG-2023]
MSWRDRLQSGSFRGVEFLTDSAQGNGGRNVAVHEFPLQEQHYSEDLGKSAGSERLTVYLIGADYDLARDQLITALDQQGPGKLTHPYRGSQLIQVQDYEWTISSRRGGFCQFTIRYVTAGKRQAPATVSTGSALVAAATAAQAQTETAFSNTFDCAGQPAFVVESSTSFLESAFDSLNAINGSIAAELNQIEDIAIGIEGLTSEVTDLVLQPLTLISNVGAVVTSVIGGFNSISNAFNAYSNLLTAFGITDPISRTAATGTATETRARMADNQEAISTQFSAIATVALVVRIADSSASEFDSLQQAREIRDALLDQLDEQLESETLTADQYDTTSALATALQRHITAIEPGLLDAQTLAIDVSLPALVVAHQQYGDATRADELTERNGIENPLFVPAGTDLEVLL